MALNQDGMSIDEDHLHHGGIKGAMPLRDKSKIVCVWHW